MSNKTTKAKRFFQPPRHEAYMWLVLEISGVIGMGLAALKLLPAIILVVTGGDVDSALVYALVALLQVAGVLAVIVGVLALPLLALETVRASARRWLRPS